MVASPAVASTSRLPRLQAYYSSRNAASTETTGGDAGTWQCPPLDKRMWYKAVDFRPVPDGWSFQDKPFRQTPHPFEMTRFYKTTDPKDCRTGGTPWFGYSQQRWNQHWLPKHEETVTCPEPTLDEIRHMLTNKFGTLTVAFDYLDFVKNGKISALEWSQGLFNLFYGTSKATHDRPSENPPLRYQLSKIPRWLFNEQMKKLFMQMDLDKNGQIGYQEFAHARGHPIDHPHEFTAKRSIAKNISGKSGMTKSASASLPFSKGKEDIESDRESDDGSRPKTPLGTEQDKELYDFSALLLYKFPSLREAFKSLDLNKNGSLSAIEFENGARHIGYEGNGKEIFRRLDKDKNGQISVNEFETLIRPSKRAIKRVAKRLKEKQSKKSKWESEIRPPATMRRCLSLPELDITLPMGEHMASSAGFFAFSRSPTRRLQMDFHPNEYPGQDAFNYEDIRGPGTYHVPEGSLPYGGHTKRNVNLYKTK